MLKKSYRLRKQDVERVYKKGKSLNQDFVLMRFLPNRAAHARFAVIIPKKVLAHATDRNRARRLIFNFLEANAPVLNKGFDITLSFRKAPGADTNLALTQLLEKIQF